MNPVRDRSPLGDRDSGMNSNYTLAKEHISNSSNESKNISNGVKKVVVPNAVAQEVSLRDPEVIPQWVNSFGRIMLIGLFILFSGCRGPNSFFPPEAASRNLSGQGSGKKTTSDAKEGTDWKNVLCPLWGKKKKIPKGLKTKTLECKSAGVSFSPEDDNEYSGDSGLTIYKYDERGNKIEETTRWYDAEEEYRPITTTSLYKYKYDDRGNLIEKTDYDGHMDKLTYKHLYKYDNRGNEIEEVVYNADGKLLSNKSLFNYDDKGNVIEEAVYNADGELQRKSLTKYDDKGNVIEETSYDADGKLQWKSLTKYDDSGNLIEKANYRCYDADGKLTYKLLSKYDARGKLIEEANLYYDPDKPPRRVCKYDDRGTRIEDFYYCGDKFTGKTLYKYDDRGNLIEKALYDADGKLEEKSVYKYDDRGNLIEYAKYCDGRLEEESVFKYNYNDDNQIERVITYEVRKFFGKVMDVSISQTVWEYEYYPEKK